MSEPPESPARKAVGVYDRPAKADRARYVRIVVIVVAIVVSVGVAYLWWT